ncbi:von Willebrand factor A domain-containing protein 5A-like [Argopecten irradians]|uniref:von Willebrand factor A domain-containing protein 5A-like n=1 Tax=Argopecten irradians TaxID=31199 RepID=UPI00371F58AB
MTKNSLEEALKLQEFVLDANLGGTERNTATFGISLCQGVPVDGWMEAYPTPTKSSLWRGEKCRQYKNLYFGIGEGEHPHHRSYGMLLRLPMRLATFVTDKEKLDRTKVMTVLNLAMQQPVTNLNLEWNLSPGCTAINIPQQAPVVFKGQKVITYALINGVEHLNEDTQCSAVLKGDIGKENSIHYTLNFDLMTMVKSDDSFPVHRLAAKTQIKDFETAGDDSKKGEITLLSMSANVVSRYTAFVGVDKDKKELVDGGRLVKRPYFYGYLPMGVFALVRILLECSITLSKE